LSDLTRARPLQAAVASAAAFAAGATLPLVMAVCVPVARLAPVVVMGTLLLLALLGATAARLGGAPIGPAATRVLLWGALAMGGTALVGRLFGATG
jgi:VIT1/CCC1 family predicted Fe2+/Mn2+ transporter